MRIANVLAGFSLAEADVLRKAVGKKDAELIKKELGQVRRARRGPRASAEAWPRSWRRRSRPSAATASTSRTRWRTRSCRYQTAWLKAHYPAEFMAALLSSEIGNTDKVVQYINEARELGLEVLPPDVNESGFKFTVVGEQRIRFGLGAVRNVGRGRHRVDHRRPRRTAPFTTLGDFVGADRPPALQQAGARVADRGRRLRLARRPPGAAARRRSSERCGEAQLLQQEREAGQASLFGEGSAPRATRSARCPRCRPGPRPSGWRKEKEMLGFFISGHPLERFRAEVELFGTRTTATLGEWSEHQVTRRARWSPRSSGRSPRRPARSTRGSPWRTFTGPPRRSSSPTPGPGSTRSIHADAAVLLDRRVQRARPGRGTGAVRRGIGAAARGARGLAARWR